MHMRSGVLHEGRHWGLSVMSLQTPRARVGQAAGVRRRRRWQRRRLACLLEDQAPCQHPPSTNRVKGISSSLINFSFYSSFGDQHKLSRQTPSPNTLILPQADPPQVWFPEAGVLQATITSLQGPIVVSWEATEHSRVLSAQDRLLSLVKCAQQNPIPALHVLCVPVSPSPFGPANL